MLSAQLPLQQLAARQHLGLGQRLAGLDHDHRGDSLHPKNPDGSTTERSVYHYNKQTGQFERVDAGAQQEQPATSLEGKPVVFVHLPFSSQSTRHPSTNRLGLA